MPSLTVLERYGQVGEFAALLGAAELNAATDWDEQFLADLRSNFQRFAGHTLGEIAIGVATKKDVFDAAWLQSRFALTTEEAERVVLQLLDQGVIVLEQENEESRELNTYRVVKKPGDIALDLE
ncbi:hypothetical protein IPC825_25100 [Pseudomonas aeruginosa]|uniref:hypothetical protein n=1 Tax=Pseudomonas aeruginosa TaxID=287 RepID=UPI000F86E974|nr:hypothetical protein [Pseudomonas aeruginosa]RUF78481.1 hypothetical protein IPC825_25100 [Pseudomonas aeruginosa]